MRDVPAKSMFVLAMFEWSVPENLVSVESNVPPMWVTFRRVERLMDPGTSVVMSTREVARSASRRFAVTVGSAAPAPLWMRPAVPAMTDRAPMAMVRAQVRSAERPARARSTE